MTMFTDDTELDALLRAADPIDQQALHSTATSTAATELGRAITRAAGHRPALTRFRRSVVLTGVAAAAAVAAIALSVVPSSRSNSASGAALVHFAENSPRLLVGADGWRVTRADEEDAGSGEMKFARGAVSVDLFWTPGATSKESDKADMTPAGSTPIDGHSAWVGYYGTPTDGEYEAIWSDGDRALDVRGVFADKPDFDAVVTTLHRVDVPTWLAAMPASVVDPSSRLAVVEAMLADIPQPAGFDVDSLSHAAQVRDRYQLGAAVTGAVSCAWLRQWLHGDQAERQEAAAAMQGSRNWKTLRQMTSEGEYSQVVWELADAMNGKPFPLPPHTTLEQWAKPALGC